MSDDAKRSMIPAGYPGWVLLLFFWTAMGSLAYARYYLQNGAAADVTFEWLTWLTCFVPWIGLSIVVFHLERRYPLTASAWPRHGAALALASVPVTYAAGLVMVALSALVQAWFDELQTMPSPWWRVPGREIAVQQALYWCAVAASGVIRRLVELHGREQEAARLALEKSQLEGSLRQAELDLLRMRMNPHFLFNSLQNISVLTEEDPRTASRMLAHLGDVLRLCLRADVQPETTVESEVALAEAYVAIEKMRFSDRLTVVFDIDAGARQASVPTLLMQPLIENAIVHGLQRVRVPGVIVVNAVRHDDSLILTVTDNGAGPSSEDLSQVDMGIGLGATCERLERMYPHRHSVSMRRLPEGGTQITLVIPFRLAEAPAPSAAHG